MQSKCYLGEEGQNLELFREMWVNFFVQAEELCGCFIIKRVHGDLAPDYSRLGHTQLKTSTTRIETVFGIL